MARSAFVSVRAMSDYRAAVGTPHTVFPLDAASLIEYAQGRVVDVRERTS